MSKSPIVAGSGSMIDPSKPVYKGASGYSPAENVNQGRSGGRKGRVSGGHGQTSDEMGAKDKLVEMGESQKDPYRAEGKDFPVKHVDARTGQSGAQGKAEGKDQLANASDCPRTIEDDGWGQYGSGTPARADRGTGIAAAFPIEQNQGEASSDTGEVGISESVNLQTGHVEAGSRTRVGEVPESKVSIGSRR